MYILSKFPMGVGLESADNEIPKPHGGYITITGLTPASLHELSEIMVWLHFITPNVPAAVRAQCDPTLHVQSDLIQCQTFWMVVKLLRMDGNGESVLEGIVKA
ncbi:hypothetical protein BsWGS_11407 [Bradybaena similaris]